jgi:chaperonin GroES
MKVEPLHEKVLVKPFPPEEVTSGGIIVPDSVKERPSKGTVIAVGKGTPERPMYLKKGQVVFHVKLAGVKLEIDGEEHFLMRDTDCLAILS